MGRHARGAARSRLPMANVMLGVLVVVGLAVACWAVFGAQPASQRTVVSGSAVVAASLACPDGGGIGDSPGTLVDLQNPLGGTAARTVRASLDACGYQEGQQVAVEFAPGDPLHVTLAGSSGSGDADGTGTRLLPVGIAIAGLLAVGAALAVVLDCRRNRRRGRTAAHSQLENPDAAVGGIAWFPRRGGVIPADRADAHGERDGVESGATGGVPDTADGDGVGHGPLSVVTVLPAPAYAVVGDRSVSKVRSGPDERSPQLSSIDLVFPFSAGLAASLHDELFTHRSPVG